jgi:hypothetical protein
VIYELHLLNFSDSPLPLRAIQFSMEPVPQTSLGFRANSEAREPYGRFRPIDADE